MLLTLLLLLLSPPSAADMSLVASSPFTVLLLSLFEGERADAAKTLLSIKISEPESVTGLGSSEQSVRRSLLQKLTASASSAAHTQEPGLSFKWRKNTVTVTDRDAGCFTLYCQEDV